MMISNPQARQLRSRWNAELTADVNRALVSRRLDCDDRIGWVEWAARRYRDLRGISITERILDLTLDSIDLSCCTLDGAGQFDHTRFENCRFIDSKLTTNFGDIAVKCDFSGATFGNALRGEYTECRFEGAKFGKVTGREKLFTRCDFTNADWRQAVLLYSTFDHCVWKACVYGFGSFCWSKFIGTRPDENALGDTMMDGAEFEGLAS